MGQLKFLLVVGLVAMVRAVDVNSLLDVPDLDENDLEEAEAEAFNVPEEREVRQAEAEAFNVQEEREARQAAPTTPIDIESPAFQNFLLHKCLAEGRDVSDLFKCALIPLEAVFDLDPSTRERSKCIAVIKMKYCFNYMLGRCTFKHRFVLKFFQKQAIKYVNDKKECQAKGAWPGDDFVPTDMNW